MRQQADAVAELRLNELEGGGDSIVIIRADADEAQRCIAHKSLLASRFSKPTCKKRCCRTAVTSVVDAHRAKRIAHGRVERICLRSRWAGDKIHCGAEELSAMLLIEAVD